jgi:glutamyl-tRNA synthetase
MSRDELIDRFSLERVGASPATLDYAKLDWMNGVYLRAMSHDEFAGALVTYLGDQGYDWPAELVWKAAATVQEKIGRLGEFPAFAGFLFHDVEPDPVELDAEILAAAATALEAVEQWKADEIEGALKALCEGLGRKPREVYPPIRVAVTGSRVSPGLYESLELLRKDETLARIRRGEQLASGS